MFESTDSTSARDRFDVGDIADYFNAILIHSDHV